MFHGCFDQLELQMLNSECLHRLFRNSTLFLNEVMLRMIKAAGMVVKEKEERKKCSNIECYMLTEHVCRTNSLLYWSKTDFFVVASC